MSITKAVIGLLYRVYKVDDTAPFLTHVQGQAAGNGTQIRMALNHRAGMHDGDDGVFDYNGFRYAVDRKMDMFEYAKSHLASNPKPGEFGYSNLAWQILARRFHDLTGMHCDAALEKMIGHGGWTWECDAAGCPLGPHGIDVDPAAAVRIGELAHKTFDVSDFTILTAPDFWPYEELPSPRYVCNGWLAVKSPVFLMYAMGFQSQYIVVINGEVIIQLRGNDQKFFDEAAPDAERLLVKRLLQERALLL